MHFAWPTLFHFAKLGAWYNPEKRIFPEMTHQRVCLVDVSTGFSEQCRNGVSADRKDINSTLLATRDPRMGDKLTEEGLAGEAHLLISAGKYQLLHFSYLPNRILVQMSKAPIRHPRPSLPPSSTSPAIPTHTPNSPPRSLPPSILPRPFAPGPS